MYVHSDYVNSRLNSKAGGWRSNKDRCEQGKDEGQEKSDGQKVKKNRVSFAKNRTQKKKTPVLLVPREKLKNKNWEISRESEHERYETSLPLQRESSGEMKK